MKIGRMLEDSECGLKKGDIVDIVKEKRYELVLIYKKGISGHDGLKERTPKVCKNRECWWVHPDDIEIINEVDWGER